MKAGLRLLYLRGVDHWGTVYHFTFFKDKTVVRPSRTLAFTQWHCWPMLNNWLAGDLLNRGYICTNLKIHFGSALSLSFCASKHGNHDLCTLIVHRLACRLLTDNVREKPGPCAAQKKNKCDFIFESNVKAWGLSLRKSLSIRCTRTTTEICCMEFVFVWFPLCVQQAQLPRFVSV